MSFLPHASARRGATAVEFALISPFLVSMLLGIVDFGWYFFEQAQVVNALRDGVRAGALRAPAPEDPEGTCSACTEVAAAVIMTELAALDIAVSATAVTPRVEDISGACALVLEPTITHTALIGMVPLPATYGVRIVGYAQNVEGC